MIKYLKIIVYRINGIRAKFVEFLIEHIGKIKFEEIKLSHCHVKLYFYLLCPLFIGEACVLYEYCSTDSLVYKEHTA